MTEPTMQEQLRAPFAPNDYKPRVERGTTKSGQPYERTFTYVEDEKVMNRLDDVFGVGNWGITITPIDKNTAKVRLEVVGLQPMEAIGVAENTDAKESAKEAVTDGIRRVGSYLGIARDVYEGKVAPGGGQIVPQAPRTAPVAPQPQSATPAPANAVAAAQAVFGDDLRTPQRGDACPIHPDQTLNGTQGADLYHTNGQHDNGKKRYCRPYAQPRGR